MTRRPPRHTEGNVTYLTVPSTGQGDRWWWMPRHAAWWRGAEPSLEWKAIDLYTPDADEGMAIASPVLLRSGDRWMYGSFVKGEWRRFSEGGSWLIEGFAPTHWTVPTLDDAIMLGQD